MTVHIERDKALKPRNTKQVYFIFAPRLGLIKIGVATSAPHRLKKLQCGTGERLCLLATVPGDHELEAELHRRFAGDRVRGEWFLPSGALLAEAGLSPDDLLFYIGAPADSSFDWKQYSLWTYEDAESILHDRCIALANDYKPIKALREYMLARWGQAPEIPSLILK
jgi:hypothetical protein